MRMRSLTGSEVKLPVHAVSVPVCFQVMPILRSYLIIMNAFAGGIMQGVPPLLHAASGGDPEIPEKPYTWLRDQDILRAVDISRQTR